jgi:hypothetical protein
MKTSFSVTRKKTPFAKHKEDEEAKKKVRQGLGLLPFGVGSLLGAQQRVRSRL